MGGQGDAHVRGERLEAADLDDFDAGLLGVGVDIAGGARHEWHFSREVDVVGSARDAGFDDGPPVRGVGADEVQDDLRALGHRLERGGVGYVGGDGRRAFDADVGEGGRELLGAARGRGPCGAHGRCPLVQILGDLAPGDARGAEEGYVDVSLGHRPILGGAMPCRLRNRGQSSEEGARGPRK